MSARYGGLGWASRLGNGRGMVRSKRFVWGRGKETVCRKADGDRRWGCGNGGGEKGTCRRGLVDKLSNVKLTDRIYALEHGDVS